MFFAEQELDAARDLLDDGLLALDHLVDIDREVVHRDAEFVEIQHGFLELLGRCEQRLRRNAAYIQARAAEFRLAGMVDPFLDVGDLFSELRCADRRDVTARGRSRSR